MKISVHEPLKVLLGVIGIAVVVGTIGSLVFEAQSLATYQPVEVKELTIEADRAPAAVATSDSLPTIQAIEAEPAFPGEGDVASIEQAGKLGVTDEATPEEGDFTDLGTEATQQVSEIEASMESLSQQASFTLEAPSTGTIDQVLVKVGQAVEPGDIIAWFLPHEDVLNALESEVRWAGKMVPLIATAAGVIKEISVTVGQTVDASAQVMEMAEPPPKPTKVLAIPAWATNDKIETKVDLLVRRSDGKTETRSIEIGKRIGDWVEVKTNLALGEQVLYPTAPAKKSWNLLSVFSKN